MGLRTYVLGGHFGGGSLHGEVDGWEREDRDKEGTQEGAGNDSWEVMVIVLRRRSEVIRLLINQMAQHLRNVALMHNEVMHGLQVEALFHFSVGANGQMSCHDNHT